VSVNASDPTMGVIDFTNPFGAIAQEEAKASEPDQQKEVEAPKSPTETQTPQSPEQPEAPKEEPKPEPESKKVSLDDFTYPDVEGAHGLIKGKPLSFVDKQLRELEGHKTRIETENNKLRGELSAIETELQFLREQSRRSAPPKREEAPQEPEIDLEHDWLANPKKAASVLLQEAERIAEEKVRRLQEQQLQERVIVDVETATFNAMKRAFEERQIPVEKWETVFDVVIEPLTRQGGRYFSEGGPTNPANYHDLLDQLGVFPRPGVKPLPPNVATIEPQPDPPGNKRSVPAPLGASSNDFSDIPGHVREGWEHFFRTSGLPDSERDDFYSQAAQRYRNRKKGY
jgi:hypothetical protein